MFKILGNRRQACCGNQMLDRFHSSPDNYCPNQFQSYEVPPSGFGEILRTCQSWWEKKRQLQAQERSHRFVILTTFREPLSRALSAIQQMCNTHLSERTDEAQDACRACDYARDKEFWNEKLDETNRVYKWLQHQAVTDLRAEHHLWLDTADLNSMFKRLATKIPGDSQQVAFESYFGELHNPEKLDVCSFNFSSEAMRVLSPSVELYRKFIDESFIT